MPAARPAAQTTTQHLRLSDLQGLAQLAAQGTVGVANIAEGVHANVLRTLGLPVGQGAATGRTRGLTGFVYRSVRGIARVAGAGSQAVLSLLPVSENATGSSPQREAALAALNGVLGDQLAANSNPLATRMGLYQNGEPVDPLQPPAAANGKILLLVHGLCMNDLQWASGGQDHGQQLAQALGYTPLYLRYNTGQHVSDNGAALATLLQQLVAHWPQPVDDITVVAHSMGGLVTRSACQLAEQAGMPWRSRLRHIVFLGTPHHGAPLEQAGHWVDLLLDRARWTAPFARLGHVRSAGITDLRHGHVQAADRAEQDRFGPSHADTRLPLPLPAGVACFALAATTASELPAARPDHWHPTLVGDGLVPVRSALGAHDDPAMQLHFPEARQFLATGVNHMQLLSDAGVAQQMLHWLTPATTRSVRK